MYFVYIIRSELDSSFYIGYSRDLFNRIREHNFGRTRYTSLKRPWTLVYKEEYKTRKEAYTRERYLKSLKSKKYLNYLINKKSRSLKGP